MRPMVVKLLAATMWIATSLSFAEGSLEKPQVAMVLHYDGILYATLPDAVDIDADCLSAKDLENYLPGPAPMEAAAERKLLDALNLALQQKILVYLPFNDTKLTTQLDGLSHNPTGDGGYSGILLRLGEVSIKSAMDGQLVCGVTYFGPDADYSVLEPVSVGESRSELHSDVSLPLLCEHSKLEAINSYNTEKISFESVEVDCASEGQSRLYSVQTVNGRGSLIPFVYSAAAREDYLVLSERRRMNDMTPINTQYAYFRLTMGDQNKIFLLASSNVSFLFALEESPSIENAWRMVHRYYQGP